MNQHAGGDTDQCSEKADGKHQGTGCRIRCGRFHRCFFRLFFFDGDQFGQCFHPFFLDRPHFLDQYLGGFRALVGHSERRGLGNDRLGSRILLLNLQHQRLFFRRRLRQAGKHLVQFLLVVGILLFLILDALRFRRRLGRTCQQHQVAHGNHPVKDRHAHGQRQLRLCIVDVDDFIQAVIDLCHFRQAEDQDNH